MKKLVLFLAIITPSAYSFAQTAVSGHIVTLDTKPAAGVIVRFTLRNTGGKRCKVKGTKLPKNYAVELVSDASGKFAGTVYSNDEIVCKGQPEPTYYGFGMRVQENNYGDWTSEAPFTISGKTWVLEKVEVDPRWEGLQARK